MTKMYDAVIFGNDVAFICTDGYWQWIRLRGYVRSERFLSLYAAAVSAVSHFSAVALVEPAHLVDVLYAVSEEMVGAAMSRVRDVIVRLEKAGEPNEIAALQRKILRKLGITHASAIFLQLRKFENFPDEYLVVELLSGALPSAKVRPRVLGGITVRYVKAP